MLLLHCQTATELTGDSWREILFNGIDNTLLYHKYNESLKQRPSNVLDKLSEQSESEWEKERKPHLIFSPMMAHFNHSLFLRETVLQTYRQKLLV